MVPWLNDTIVLCVWPLRPLPIEDDSFEVGNGGPCNQSANRVASMRIAQFQPSTNELRRPETIVHFYDDWADKVQHFLQHFRIGFFGNGIFHGLIEEESASEYSQSTEIGSIAIASPQVLEAAGLYVHQSSSNYEDELKVWLEYQEAIIAPNSQQVIYEDKKLLYIDSPIPSFTERSTSTRRTLRVASNYVYTTLDTLQEGTADVYCVVTSYSMPRRSQRGRCDYEMTISIIDESRPQRSQALYINIFEPELAKLPQILYIGDVIRLHKLRIVRYKNEIAGLCVKGTRHVVFRKGTDGELIITHPYENITFAVSDNARALSLLNWAEKLLPQDKTECPRNTHGPPRTLNRCFPNEVLDAIAFITGFTPATNEELPKFTLTDGKSTTAELIIHDNMDTFKAMKWTHVCVGQWCRLRQVQVATTDRLVLHFLWSSSIEIHPYLLSRVPQSPPQLVHITTQVPPEMAALPCMSLREFVNQKDVCKAHILAEIVDICTPRPNSITIRHGLDNVYMCVFRLQDTTASVDAILYGPDGTKFFQTIPPFNDQSQAAIIVSMMQLIPAISNTGGKPSTAPTLLFIMLVDAVFAILEDRKRHIADNVANARPTLVLDAATKQFQTKIWRDVQVGDFVKLQNHDQVPADLLILAVSEQAGMPPTGICYVETKSLDGETNMKVRQAMESTTGKCQTPESLLELKGFIHCELPNNGINSFQGVLNFDDGHKESIPYKSVLLRGCTLRNTEWIYGLVLNTGKDTKIMMNNSATPSKMSSMDVAINRYIIVLVIVLLLCCALGATGSILWDAHNYDSWYICGQTASVPDSVGDWFIMLFYFFLLMYQFVPISLYVSMSMVKYIQAIFIQWDIHMYYEETNTPALVRTMSLNEELGQVSYIFSDKTGTLTCNMMEFRKCSVGGISYGKGTTEIGLAAMKRAGLPVPEETTNDKASAVPFVNFDGPEIYDHMKGSAGKAQTDRLHNFFLHLAVCHTVIPERKEGSDVVTLSASSPDEQALVSGAAYFGYEFINRNPGKAYLRVHKELIQYELLDVLEFNSARKRMSTVVRNPAGTLMLFTKGADVVIYSRLKDASDSVAVDTSKHINTFAEEGLRTLTIAMKILDESFYLNWQSRYHAALNNLAEIDKRKKEQPNLIDSCMEELETNLELLGATAIEDKLQPGVPDTIATLAEAGIKIWVLTGDKEETAINIGYACNLLHNNMKRVVINADSFLTAVDTENELRRQYEQRCKDLLDVHVSPIALVIDGESLLFALKGSCRSALLQFSQLCKAVIACRVSPAQKAQMVGLIKYHVGGVRTLAIGDGANDVPMIQEAHIGVGISGQEGLQAVNASDYAIARFRFLKRLLLVHGRWNYLRMSQLVLYMFYKNIMLTAAEFWFTWVNGFSGQKFYLETGFQIYNVAFTSFPIILLAIYDKDVDDDMALTFPKLYCMGPENAKLNAKIFTLWIVSALVESVGITLLVEYSFEKCVHYNETPPMWFMGNVVFTLVVLLANAKLMLFQNSWSGLHHVVYVGSVGLYAAVAAIASNWDLIAGWYWSDMTMMTLTTSAFWLIILFTSITLILPTYLINAIKTEIFPEYNQLAREVSKFHLDKSLLNWAGDDKSNLASFMTLQRKSSTTGKRSLHMVAPMSEKKRQSLSQMLRSTMHNGFAFSSDDHARQAEARRSVQSQNSHLQAPGPAATSDK
ncbi:phospholipid-transporting ATPase [Thraustotheca clavata]|uniref:Phospholipid-transporting ATPase n=1 Tax=Thraustotheca clavata TaxID=74557 RepID=A0A1V9ZJT1_9STRA|nr:phospholipid-transporting ATPase [Thraustotheca clavata]